MKFLLYALFVVLGLAAPICAARAQEPATSDGLAEFAALLSSARAAGAFRPRVDAGRRGTDRARSES